MKIQQRFRILVLGSLLFVGWFGAAQGQETSLAIGNTEPVRDIFGRPFFGDWDTPSNEACRVEIREVGTSIVAPDPVTGEGNDAQNPLLCETRIGQVVVIERNTGKFSKSLSDRLPQGVEYFARVYDASLPGDSYYYANSLPFKDVPPDQQAAVSTLDVVFQDLHLWDTSLDDGDTDGDGIPNWMEPEFYGTDANASDTDGDGYNDKFEVLHSEYVDPTEKNPNEIQLYLPDFSEPPSETNEYYVRWWTIPGVDYRLEYRDVMMDGVAFSNIWNGTALDSQTNLEISVDDWVQTNVGIKGFFRYLIP